MRGLFLFHSIHFGQARECGMQPSGLHNLSLAGERHREGVPSYCALALAALQLVLHRLVPVDVLLERVTVQFADLFELL